VDDSAAPVSPWHDLPLHGGGGRAGASSPLFNCVCEVPRGSRAEYRLSTSVAHNPLVFARAADGAPRALALATLAHHGVLPQTYEDPAERDAATGARGDGGPLDVCEIGTLGAPTVRRRRRAAAAAGAAPPLTLPPLTRAPRPRAQAGAIYQVRVLGALAVLDEGGRVDWKILALRADDPQAATLADIAGAPASVARLAEDIRTWFRLREVPRGGAERRLALDGAWQGREAALAIVEASHARWRALTARARTAAAAEARAIAYGEEALLARACRRCSARARAQRAAASRHYHLARPPSSASLRRPRRGTLGQPGARRAGAAL